MADMIQEFENKGTHFAVFEYDPLADTAIGHAMERMGWTKDEAIEYAKFMLDKLRAQPHRILMVPSGMLVLKREGMNDPSCEQLAEVWNKRPDVAAARVRN